MAKKAKSTRKTPHRPSVDDLSKQMPSFIKVHAPPGMYAGVDYDGNGVLFRRVDTHYGEDRVSTHLETLNGERIAPSTIAQWQGPLPEFGDNPEFAMLITIPTKD